MTDRNISRRAALKGAAGVSAAPFVPLSVAGQPAGGDDNTDVEPIRGVRTVPASQPWSRITVGVGTDLAADALQVVYGTDALDQTELVPATRRAVPWGRQVAGFELTDLTPDTTYRYQVRSKDGSAASDTYQFTTAPRPENTGEFTVAQIADNGVDDDANPCNRAHNHRPRKVIERAKAVDPAFLMISGDISYSNGKPTTWERYFEVNQDVFAEVPIATVPGNHEREIGWGFQQYDGYLNHLMPMDQPAVATEEPEEPRKQRWYDFQYGNAIFINLDIETGCYGEGGQFYPILDNEFSSYDDRPCDGERSEKVAEELVEGPQLQYVREVLERAEGDPSIKWKIVQFHHPMVAAAPDHADNPWAREYWGPLFDQYDVDLVLSGDNHLWHRSRPIRFTGVDHSGSGDETTPPGRTPGYGTTYLTNGTGGITSYVARTSAFEGETASVCDQTFGVTKMTFSEEAITVEYVHWVTSETIDEFRIVKDDKGRPTQSPAPADRFRWLNYRGYEHATSDEEDEYQEGLLEVTRKTEAPEAGFRPGDLVTYEVTCKELPEIPRPPEENPYKEAKPPVQVRVEINHYDVIEDDKDTVRRVEAPAEQLEFAYLNNGNGAPVWRPGDKGRLTIRIPADAGEQSISSDNNATDQYRRLYAQYRDPGHEGSHLLRWTRGNAAYNTSPPVFAPENGPNDDNCGYV